MKLTVACEYLAELSFLNSINAYPDPSLQRTSLNYICKVEGVLISSLELIGFILLHPIIIIVVVLFVIPLPLPFPPLPLVLFSFSLSL